MRRRAALLGLGVGLALADSSIVTLALPEILGRFDVGITTVAWVLTSFNLVLAAVVVPAAYVSRRRPREAFVVGVVVFAAASLTCGLAPSFGVLVGARCVQAVGRRCSSRLRSTCSPSVRGSDEAALRVWVAAGVLGAAIGPAVGGVLTAALGWEWIFLVQVPVALVLLVALRGLAVPAGANAGRAPVGERERRAAPRRRRARGRALPRRSAPRRRLEHVAGCRRPGGDRDAGHGDRRRTIPAALARADSRSGVRRRAPRGRPLCARALPEPGWEWTIPPQLLVGAGLGLTVAGLTELAVAGRPEQRRARRLDARRAPCGRRARARAARAGSHECAREEPDRGDPRRRRGRAGQPDPAARQARRRPGRPRGGRPRPRRRQAARRRASARRPAARRRLEGAARRSARISSTGR